MKRRDRYPRTVEALTALPDGEAALEHIEALERGFAARPAGVIIRDDGPGSGEMDFDVALAGGGLSLVYAAYLARAGFRVAVFDRGRIGRAHREWNISRRELAPLVESGLVTEEELGRLVLCGYDHGIVRWHGGQTYRVREVLDCVVDAQALLDLLRARCLEAGATLMEGRRLTGYRVGRGGVLVEMEDAAGGAARLSARVLLDGTGAMSPHARFDLVCPTVGGVMAGLDVGPGLDQLDPRVGEILVSTEGVEENRQHIWEGFPAPVNADARATLYLFYYAEPDTLGDEPLYSLYERFFELRARYKRGAAVLEKPTYGFIPAYTRLRPVPTAPSDRVLLVGDAAGRHSPLTFCGFGSMIRSFRPVADRLRVLLERDRLTRGALAATWSEPPCLRLLGALALMMIPPGGRGALGPPVGDGPRLGPDEINRLLDVAFGALATLGEPIFAAMVRDEIGFADFARFMLRTARRRPSIYREVFSQLTPVEIATWSTNFARLGGRALLAGR